MIVVVVVIAVNPPRASAAWSKKRGKRVREQLPNVALEAAQVQAHAGGAVEGLTSLKHTSLKPPPYPVVP